VEVGGLLVGVASVIVAIIALGGGSHENSSDSEPTRGELSLVDLTVRDIERGPGQPHAHVEITVHNLGGRLVVVDRAEIEIRHVYELRRCASQDDLPLSNEYGILLPVTAHPGAVFKEALHQQIGSDEADRFALSLSAETHGRGRGSLYLFDLDIDLRDDGPQSRLHLGRVQIALPQIPVPGEYYWAAGTAELIRDLATTSPEYVRELRTYSMPCWRSNTAMLRKAFAIKAGRSAQMKAVLGEFVAPSFAAIE
jgi:hypothetical protein